MNAVYNGAPRPFTFEGRTDMINPGIYNIYQLTISGVLSPNTFDQTFMDKFNELKVISRQLEILFDVTDLMIDQYILIFFPENTEDTVNWLDIRPIYVTSYFEYMKDVMIKVSNLSKLPINFLFINPTIQTIKSILTKTFTINDVYQLLRRQLIDNDPIFVINPLCRGYIQDRAQRSNNSNIEMNIRGTRNRSNRSRYAVKRKITRKKIMHNAFKEVLNSVYRNGIKKRNINVNTLANLSGIGNVAGWRNYLDHIQVQNNALIKKSNFNNEALGPLFFNTTAYFRNP
jgi:hypothetical protein